MDEQFASLATLGQKAVESSASPDEPSSEFAKLEDLVGQDLLTTEEDWKRALELAEPLAARLRNLRLYGLLCRAAVSAWGFGALAAALRSYQVLLSAGVERLSPTTPRRCAMLFDVLASKLVEGTRFFLEHHPMSALAADPGFNACVAATAALRETAKATLGHEALPWGVFWEELQRHTRAAPGQEVRKVDAPVKKSDPPAPTASAAVAAPAPEPPKETALVSAAPPPAAVAPVTPPAAATAVAEAPPAAQVAPVPPVTAPVTALVSVAAPPPPVAASADGEANKLGPPTRQAVIALCAALRKEAANDPTPYRLLRGYLFATVRPVTAACGKAGLPAPSLAQVDALARRLRSQGFRELLADCEDQLAITPYWFDLHHISYLCLDALGFQEARDAVAQEVQHLLARTHALQQGTFSGEIAFVDAYKGRVKWEGTRRTAQTCASWLDGLGQPVSSAGAAPRPVAMPAMPSPVATPAEALPAGFLEGLAALQEQLRGAAAGVTRFDLRLRVAELCLAEGRSDLATGPLEWLAEEAERQRLWDWDPERLARLLRCQAQCAPVPSVPTALRRLCLLWPAVAAGLGAPTS